MDRDRLILILLLAIIVIAVLWALHRSQNSSRDPNKKYFYDGGDGSKPVPSFTVSSTLTLTGQISTFTDRSSGNPTSWQWDFGDGDTSSVQNPVHTYSVAGSYDVGLRVANAFGASEIVEPDFVTAVECNTDPDCPTPGDNCISNVCVTPFTPPVADFSATPVNPSIGQNVTFTDLSTNLPTSWLWDFGDGNTSTLQNPTHAYYTLGPFAVTLTATNAYGSDTITVASYINVVQCNQDSQCNSGLTCIGNACVSSMSFTPSSGPIGTLVTITNPAMNFTGFNYVDISGTPCVVISSTPTSVVAFVMPNTISGTIAVTTVANGTFSSTAIFTVTPSVTPVLQQGPKLVDSGLNSASQGTGVALSADGHTLAVASSSYYSPGSVPGILIYTRTAGVWSQQGSKLVAGGEIGNAQLGSDSCGVAISADGNTVIAGGPSDNSNQGAVWVFTRTAGVWSQEAKLVATGNIGPAQVGNTVHVSADGNTLIAGGWTDNSTNGAAWIFVRNAGVWTQQAKLVGSGNIGIARQSAVAISSDGNTAGLGGDLDNGGIGAVWIFIRNGGNWFQQAKLVGSDYSGVPRIAGCAFSANGNIVAISGGTDGGNGSFGRGAIWIFDRNFTTWTQRGSKYVLPGTDSNSQSGTGPGGLSADGEIMVASGWRDNGDRGASWVLTRNGGTWNQVIKIPNPELGSNYGNAPAYISSDSTTMAVGSRISPSNSGIGGVFVYV